jgi:thymidylate kinase
MSSKNYKRVALIGLDGSGKSANIAEMKTDKDYTNYNFVWVRWEPTLLKPAYWLLGKNINKKSGSSSNASTSSIPLKNTPEQVKLSSDYNAKSGMKGKIFKNPIIRTAWITLAVLDYFVQFQVKTIGLTLGKKNIIFDRFYLDLFVDQGINFGYTPTKIEKEIKKFQWLFPKMDRIVYIRVSPKTCFNRKDDIPNMDYLLKRYDIYEHLSGGKIWKSVDGEETFKFVNGNIKKLILG